ncbi:MAG: tyrosine-type recombinase/integrase [Acidimicrobiales bacterium]
MARPGDRVIGVRGKGNKERTVPLEPEVEVVLSDYIETRLRRFPGRIRIDAALFVNNSGQPMKRGGLQYLVDSLYRASGYSLTSPGWCTCPMLRHTFATSLAPAMARRAPSYNGFLARVARHDAALRRRNRTRGLRRLVQMTRTPFGRSTDQRPR